MTERIIASGDAHPIPPTGDAREFRTTGEDLYRLCSAPEIAALCFNGSAPNASLIALALARTSGAIGIAEIVMELSIPKSAQEALEAARDAVEEVRLILHELQRRDGHQYAGGANRATNEASQ